MSHPRHPLAVIGTSIALFILCLTALQAVAALDETPSTAAAVPETQVSAGTVLPAWQHPWPMLGHDAAHSSFTPQSGPEAPVVQPLPWPFNLASAASGSPSPPVIGSDGTGYFGTPDGFLYALRPTARTDTRLEKWEFEADGPIKSAPALKPATKGAAEVPPSPVRVYFTTEEGHVYGVTTAGGAIWDIDLSTNVVPRSSPVVAPTSNPALSWTYLGTTAGVYALQETGNTFSPTVGIGWHAETVQTVNRVALSPDGDRLYATAGSDFVALDAGSGDVLCRTQLQGGLASPVVDGDNRVFVASDNGSLFIIGGASCPDPRSPVPETIDFGAPLYHPPALAPDGQIAVIAGNTLYMHDTTIDAHTWTFEPDSWEFASPAIVDGAGTVFVAGNDSKVRGIRGGQDVWDWGITGSDFTAPAIGQAGRLYIGSNTAMNVIQTKPIFKIVFDKPLISPATDLYVSTTGDDSNDCRSRTTACRAIQAGIDKAPSGATVHVATGTYTESVALKENVTLLGKAPHLTTIAGHDSVITGADGATVARFTIANAGSGTSWGYFTGLDSSESMTLRNNVFTGHFVGVHAGDAGQRLNIFNNVFFDNDGAIAFGWTNAPVIRNNIVANNGYGIHYYTGGAPDPQADIDYNDVWSNTDYDYAPEIEAGPNDISANPLFVDAAAGDYHLLPCSPAIDAGDPSFDYSNEPEPNGGRINMGAYGNTMEAAPFNCGVLARLGFQFASQLSGLLTRTENMAQFDDVNRDVFTLREAYGQSGSEQQLTDEPEWDIQPTYSTRGEWMAFSSDRDGTFDIFLGTSGARELQNLTQGAPFGVESAETDPAFSPTDLAGQSLLPDGKRYLALTRDDRRRSLHFIDLDELWATGTVDATDLDDWLIRQGVPEEVLETRERAEPALAPDGTKLAYSACTQTPSNYYLSELVVIDLVNDSRSVVREISLVDSCSDFAPAFAPDGRHLVYQIDQGSVHDIWVTDDMTAQGTRIESDLDVEPHPAWSPDGTEIVYARERWDPELSLDVAALYVLRGPQYVSETLIAPLGDNAQYHPRRLPELNVNQGSCDAPNSLQPARQQPGQRIQIRGCGFDIRFPENNDVYFPYVDNSEGMIKVQVWDARVDVATGLGVLVVEVPRLAGDGQLVVDTPFTESPATIPDTFEVQPVPLSLHRRDSVPGARIRIFGYGFEVDAPASYSVSFAAAGGGRVPATVEAVELDTCGTASDAETPCPTNAGPEIGWLEVRVPEGVESGPVEVSRHIGPAQVQQGFALLHPSISLIDPNHDGVPRTTGSAGVPGDDDVSPVQFRFAGRDFPYDPYFDYETVELFQIDPQPGVITRTGSVDLEADDFVSGPIDVKANSGGVLTMAAEMSDPEVAASPIVRATAPFTTPMKDLPIIFVPGTSGTYMNNTGDTFRRGWCGGLTVAAFSKIVGGTSSGLIHALALAGERMARLEAAKHILNDYQAGENVWINAHGLIHILAGCSNWMDVIKLNENNNDPIYSDIQVGDVMRKIEIPWPVNNKPIYKPLFDFIENDMGRSIVDPGGTCTDPDRNCLYLFNEDWRMGMESEAGRLSELVDRVLQETGKPKVVIITHSYGGPTTQYYLRTWPDAPSQVDQVIALGGGFMGVVRPYKILEIGDRWSIEDPLFEVVGLKPQKPQQIARDWPTAYWQMPQSNWFEDPNNICPRTGEYAKGPRECFFIEANWDAVTLEPFAPGPGRLDNATESYRFIEDAVALNPRRPSLTKWVNNVNAGKFQTALDELLNLGSPDNDSTLSCSESAAAGLGDWRCGTQGVFFHRVVGSGAPTTQRVHFETKWSVGGCVDVAGLDLCLRTRKKQIVPVQTDEGDGTIPLRSAVGILSEDGVFDSRDSRIWGLDAPDEDIDFEGDDKDDEADQLHLALTRIPSVHTLIRYLTSGQLTDISQLQDPANWPEKDEAWPFSSPEGVPDDPNQGSAAGASTASVAQTEPDGWQFELSGNPPLQVYSEDGQHAGPIPEFPHIVEQIVGVTYEHNPGLTRVFLPRDTGVYTVTLQSGGPEFSTNDLDIASLQIRSVGGDPSARRLINFPGLPISGTTTARLVWDTADPPDEPALQFDFEGTGDYTPVPPTAVLQGEVVDDTQPPTTDIAIDGNELILSAEDEGGAGVDRIIYGTDRGQTRGQVYTEPVELPPGTTYVWAFAVDRAGNSEAQMAIYETCDLPTDIDGDGAVGYDDVRRTAANWLDDGLPAFDLNSNDYVDIGDIEFIDSTVGRQCEAFQSSLAMPAGTAEEETEAVLRARVEPDAVAVGDSFAVEIAVENPENLAGFEAALAFNPAVLEVEDVTLTEMLGDSGESGRTSEPLDWEIGPSLDNGNRSLFFGGYSYGVEDGAYADGVMAHVIFRAVTAGDSPLEIVHARLADVDGALAEPAVHGTEVTVTDLEPPPPPDEERKVYLPLIGKHR